MIGKNKTRSNIFHLTAVFDLHMILGQSSLRGFSERGERRENGQRWEITAEFICKAERLDPPDLGITGCLEYAVPKEGQCFPDKALLLPTPPAQMVGF